jgi:hypothetical protein
MWNWYLVLAGIFATTPPLALFVTRFELKRSRKRIVDDLRATIFKDHEALPQIELAAARYSRGGLGERQSWAPSKTLEMLGGLFFMLIAFFGFALLFVPFDWLVDRHPAFPRIAPSVLWSASTISCRSPAAECKISPSIDLVRSAAIGGFAFLGAYIFQLQFLTRATINQELSSLSFVRSALRILMGVAMALVIYATIGVPGLTHGEAIVGIGGMGVALGFAFVIGYWPTLGLEKLTKWLKVKIKQIDSEALQSSKTIPLEVIDGIDTEISFRLEESNLFDVQNLATINPISLYAETPYTLYECFDWVLQAQLCIVVGHRGFKALKAHNIRTIFDLERAVLAEGAPQEYVCAIGQVLFGEASETFLTRIGLPPAQPPTVTADIIRHAVAIMGDDLHIHRLRALWGTILHTTAGDEEYQARWLFKTGSLPGED